MLELLNTGYFALFLIIAIGIIVGKFKIKGISLDLSAVIFVALVFGHFGIQVPPIFQKIGLLLFIYSVGIQAGPGFFDSFKKQGLQSVSLASILVIAGALTTLAAIFIFDIDNKIAVGLFAGSLTSTPGLAAAIESTQSDMASIGYGIAYPFGVIGVILFMNFIPKILKVNIKKSEKDYEEETLAEHPEITHKHYIVENPNIDGKTIGELKIRSMTEANVSRVLQDDKTIIPTAKTQLNNGNILRAVGTEEALNKIELLIGSSTEKDIPLKKQSEVQWIIVTNKKLVNKPLSQLNLFSNFGATVTRIRRSGIDLSPKPSSTLRFGDKLLIACHGNIKGVTNLLGNESKRLSETDFLPIALGIVLGILLGSVNFPLPGGINFKLGLTGGVLTTALVLSRLGKTAGVLWNISGSANQLLRQLGLLMFLAAVGTNAGSNLIETVSTYGAKLFIIGAFITIIPMLTATLIGHIFFKINFLTLMGVLTGGMTSTPGLTAIGSLTDCDAPNIGYATVYPAAMVVLILCTQFLSSL